MFLENLKRSQKVLENPRKFYKVLENLRKILEDYFESQKVKKIQTIFDMTLG